MITLITMETQKPINLSQDPQQQRQEMSNFQLDQRLTSAELDGIKIIMIHYATLVFILPDSLKPKNLTEVLLLSPQEQFFFKIPLIKLIEELETNKPKSYDALLVRFQTLIVKKYQQREYIEAIPQVLYTFNHSNIIQITYEGIYVNFTNLEDSLISVIGHKVGISGSRSLVIRMIQRIIISKIQLIVTLFA